MEHLDDLFLSTWINYRLRSIRTKKWVAFAIIVYINHEMGCLFWDGLNNSKSSPTHQ